MSYTIDQCPFCDIRWASTVGKSLQSGTDIRGLKAAEKSVNRLECEAVKSQIKRKSDRKIRYCDWNRQIGRQQTKG